MKLESGKLIIQYQENTIVVFFFHVFNLFFILNAQGKYEMLINTCPPVFYSQAIL